MPDNAHFSSSVSGLEPVGDMPEPARALLNPPEQSGKVRRNRTAKGKVVPAMGTIVERHLRSGRKSYCAQIVRKEKGQKHRESETFSTRAAAQAWIDRREGVLRQPGALKRVDDPPLKDVIDRYIDDLQDAPGRTKAQVLRTIKTYDIAGKRGSQLKSRDYIDFIRSLPVQPQTRGNYVSHLSAVVSIAEAAWGYPFDEGELRAAIKVSKKLRLTAKSDKRERRPTLDELNRVMSYFAEVEQQGRSTIPMTKIIPFALFSTRRLEEITRILRTDYEPVHDTELARVMVRDMKNPGQKKGNNIWCDLPPEAAVWVEHMLASHTDERIFPYNHRTIGTYFTDACRWLEIDDLRFHDLRHEGISRLFDMDTPIPRVAKVSGHKDWKSLQRYEHLRQTGDKYETWKWKTP